MNKQTITTGILILIILGLISAVVIGSKQKKSAEVSADINENVDILYWGTTCPHCHDTIDWIEENKIDEKITVVRKEVYENRQNSDDLSQKAKECGLDPDSIGIPLLYTTEGNCLIGTPDITKYLSDKTGGSQ